MEPNLCDINHPDGDVVLPPRKRLLAGLKRQSPESDGSLQLSLVASSLTSTYTPPSSPMSDEFNARLRKMLLSYHPNLSLNEIAEASKTAAASARKIAEAARAAAEVKAAIAARAMAAAKRALELVASLSEESVLRERRLRKNKFKKQVPVQLLYKKYQPIENCKKDEEIARKLHRAINSSPRIITKNSSGSSDSKDRKRKKPKTSSTSSEKTRVVVEQNHTSSSNGHATAAVQVDF